MFGFLNVYKPSGKTSHDIVSILRRITKIKQIGHTGTLDPFAEGVLPICIGKATRLIEYLSDDKAYIGTVQLGASTTTYDNEGTIVQQSDKRVTLNDIESILDKFRGNITQIPPIYSAIKVNGKKLYEYARKGEEVEIKPREVNISNLKIEKFSEESQQLELLIECSKGTYIRSLANDIGQELGTYGYLIKLVRVKAGNFEINNSKKLEELNNFENIEKNIISPLRYLEYPTYELTDVELEKVSNGMPITALKRVSNGKIILTYGSNLAAIAQAHSDIIKCEKVLITKPLNSEKFSFL